MLALLLLFVSLLLLTSLCYGFVTGVPDVARVSAVDAFPNGLDIFSLFLLVFPTFLASLLLLMSLLLLVSLLLLASLLLMALYCCWLPYVAGFPAVAIKFLLLLVILLLLWSCSCCSIKKI